MNHKICETIRQYDMFRQGDMVIAAVSGGADSVALFDLLCGLSITMGFRMRACHLNHCLRGDESNRDEALVRTLCREYGVELDVRRVQIQPLSKARRMSVEETAREERYRFFAELCEQYDGKVATGHTLSDTAETVILNLARGTGLTGLRGVPPVRGNIVRPLIACTRSQTEDYCFARGLYFVCDSSNADDRYTRNYIRHTVMPSLARVSEGAAQAIGRMAELVGQDVAFLEAAALTAAQTCATEDGLSAANTLALHPALRGRVIGLLLERHGIARTSARITQVERMLRCEGEKAVSAGRGGSIRVSKSGVLRVVCLRSSPPVFEPFSCGKAGLMRRKIPLSSGKTLAFQRINCEDYEIFKNITDWDLNFVADYDKIKNNVLVRTRQTGDRIRQPGRGCSKTLKKLFCELSLPDRERLCVISDEAGILWCEPVGIDERIAPDASSERLLYFEICRTENIPLGEEQTNEP